MGDSQQYEVLSFEEIDDLKKQLVLLSNRIDTTRRKLVLESKLRDAALSLHRLHSTNGRESMIGESGNLPKRHRRSVMGSRSSNNDLLSKTDDELATSTRKCEDLAQELWKLEKRAQDLQRRLLEHTAGVLQMTHKGYLRKETPPPSPDDIHDYLDDQQMPHILDGSHDFDDRSFYQTLDKMLDIGDEKQSHAELSTEAFAHHTQTILETERRLEDLNQRLRDSISLANKNSQQLPTPAVRHDGEAEDPIHTLQEQLNYLEKGFDVMQEDQNTVLQNTQRSAHATEERLEDLNTQLQGIITRTSEDSNAEYPRPPETSGKDLDTQMAYLERGLDTVEKCIQQLTDASRTLSSKSIAHEEKSGQFETVLLGLWEIIVLEEEVSRQEDQQQLDKAPNELLRTPSAQDGFTLQAFSAKVQSLFARARGLQEQKDILSRQVQHQRELNSKSDAEKDARFSNLTLELDQSKKSLEARDKEAKQSKNDLILMTERLGAIKQESTARDRQKQMEENTAFETERAERMKTEERLHADLRVKQDEFTKLEAELQKFRDNSGISHAGLLAKLDQSEKNIQDLSSELNSLREELQNRQSSDAILKQCIEQKTQEAEKAHLEMENLEAEMVRLRTEVTVAKAELDGAYGTRAQRAAEGATNPAIQKELGDLAEKNSSLLGELATLTAQHKDLVAGNAEMTQQVQILQRELSETISEYEVMTKSSIEFEKEREQLENAVDGLRDRCESLETELSDEKVRWLGVKSPGSSGGRESHPPGTTSTMVLKNEFKKMMRETRAENQKALRVSKGLSFLWLC